MTDYFAGYTSELSPGRSAIRAEIRVRTSVPRAALLKQRLNQRHVTPNWDTACKPGLHPGLQASTRFESAVCQLATSAWW